MGEVVRTKKLELNNGVVMTIEEDGVEAILRITFPSPDVRSGITPQGPVTIRLSQREWERFAS